MIHDPGRGEVDAVGCGGGIGDDQVDFGCRRRGSAPLGIQSGLVLIVSDETGIGAVESDGWIVRGKTGHGTECFYIADSMLLRAAIAMEPPVPLVPAAKSGLRS